MSFIAIIKFLPELVSLIKTILSMLEKGKTELEIKAAIKNFNASLVKAVATKDTSKLEEIFNRGKK